MQRDGVEKQSVRVDKQSVRVEKQSFTVEKQSISHSIEEATGPQAAGEVIRSAPPLHAPTASLCQYLCVAWWLVTGLMQPLQSFQIFNAAQWLRAGSNSSSSGI